MLRCEGARAPKNTVRIDRIFEIAFLMINFFLSSAAIGAFMVSTYGWGSLGVRIFHHRETESSDYTMGLGLAIWIFIGGYLNAGGVAYPLALHILFFAGLVMFIAFVLLRFREYYFAYVGKGDPTETCSLRETQELAHAHITSDRTGIALILRKWISEKNLDIALVVDILCIFVVVAVTLFFVYTLMPANAFNLHDDFYKYLVRPVRMLQSGSLQWHSDKYFRHSDKQTPALRARAGSGGPVVGAGFDVRRRLA